MKGEAIIISYMKKFGSRYRFGKRKQQNLMHAAEILSNLLQRHPKEMTEYIEHIYRIGYDIMYIYYIMLESRHNLTVADMRNNSDRMFKRDFQGDEPWYYFDTNWDTGDLNIKSSYGENSKPVNF